MLRDEPFYKNQREKQQHSCEAYIETERALFFLILSAEPTMTVKTS